MTGDLVQSDIDLARALIGAGKSDATIIAALGYRRVSTEKAQFLVHNLRNGLQVEPDPPSQPHNRPISPIEQPARAAPRRSPSPGAGKPRGSSRGRSGTSSIPWFRIALLCAVAVSVAGIFVLKRGAEVAPPLTVTLEKHELRVSGVSITGKNALDSLIKRFGVPSHTNHVSDHTRIVYAYDDLGLLLYSKDQTGNLSLLLCFETVGGASGTLNPFLGTLSVQGNLITATTDPKTLAAIPKLVLDGNATKTVVKGHYSGFEIDFAYLKTSNSLSLVQIDFK